VDVRLAVAEAVKAEMKSMIDFTHDIPDAPVNAFWASTQVTTAAQTAIAKRIREIY
jgi:hypothetical protein